MTSTNDNAEAEHMFRILDFARCHGRKIYKDQVKSLSNKKAESCLQKLVIGEYLRKVEKDRISFYTLTSKGLNLFKDMRKSQSIPEDLEPQIIENLKKAMAELEMKPWEVMFHIIHVIGKKKPVTADDVIKYFQDHFPDIKGTSRPNVYRNIKHLRMKGYTEYSKQVHLGKSEYKLSKKGEEIFYMTQADAARKLRTSEEWDTALKQVFQRMDEERKQDDEALFYILDTALPDLDKNQLICILYTQGNIYELKGHLNKAEEMYLRMEGICEEVTDTKGRAYALKGLGNVAFKQGKHAVAEQYYKRCEGIAQKLQDALLLSDVFNNLGSCSYINDDVDEALQFFEKALTLAENDKSRVASTLYNEGLCHARKEDFDKAKGLWVKSLELYQELGENIEINKVRHNLREIDRKQKREHLEEEYRRAKQTGTSHDIEKAYKDFVTFITDSSKSGGD
ncbi:MAG: tetratricopeptide repeat protein [Theionarchaea archaeon]|nr:MAG: hypothetical protein AYK19_21935 [Theionarchaea archaeon DG-70-1]MBU7028693.1 tetratricopeptide repeat protein [Theionarchaea archaeon]